MIVFNGHAAAARDGSKKTSGYIRPVISKVIEFYVDRSAACKAFEPKFEAAKKHFPNVEFVRLDGSAPANAEITKKYLDGRTNGVESYPFFVFVQPSGQAFEVHHAAPGTVENLEGWLTTMNGKQK